MECSHVGGCLPGSPQYEWLAQDLAANTRPCSLAYWHEPRYSSGEHGSNFSAGRLNQGNIWHLLKSRGVDVVLNGHDHDYERFDMLGDSPTSGGTAGWRDDWYDAQPDTSSGIRELVAGTGGKSNRARTTRGGKGDTVQYVRSGSQLLDLEGGDFGVLRLYLHSGPGGSGSYEWETVTAPTTSFNVSDLVTNDLDWSAPGSPGFATVSTTTNLGGVAGDGKVGSDQGGSNCH
jgi:hypothetical protein